VGLFGMGGTGKLELDVPASVLTAPLFADAPVI
jgi:hypothetical protein